MDLAPQLPPADLVTLEKVICCYPDMRTLVSLSSAHARRLYGFVIPREMWSMKVGIRLANLALRLQRNPFRHSCIPREILMQRFGRTVSNGNTSIDMATPVRYNIITC